MFLLRKVLILTVVTTFLIAMSTTSEASECEGYNYTKCPTGYAAVSTEMCLDGKVKRYKCETCASGYFKSQGVCVKDLKCKNGGYQEHDVCICPEGWTGTSCQTAAKCPYKTKTCAKGYHETGDTCKSGKTIYKECEADFCEGYAYASKCPTGYAALSSEMCLSGKVKKYKCETCAKGYLLSQGICIKDLKCKNGGYQDHDVCVCPEGWTGTSCQTAAKCPYKNTKCSAGYHETGNKCKTGKKTVVECALNDCSEYEYTKCPTGYATLSTEMCLSGKVKKYKCETCAKGYFKSQGVCVKDLKCKNGGYQDHDVCVCPEGWTGTTCSSAAKCPYKTKSCTKGYHETGNTCKSGKTIYKECEADFCEGYEYTKCPTGYAALSTEMCLSGKVKKYKCTTCAKGYVMHKGVCMGKDLVGKKSNQNNRNNIIIDNAINRNVYGLMKIGDTIYGNNGSNLNQKTLNSYISITNHAHGDVYGMYGNSNIYGNDSYNSSGSELSNNIDITNHGHGDVYGIYSVQSDYNGVVYGNSLSGESINNDLTNDVSITNYGNGNIYGMRGNSSLSGNELYNSSNNNLTNTINITNHGDGDVYGMYGKYVLGNKVFNNSIGNNLTNTINITNQGYGDVYGMYGESVSGNDTWEADNNLTNIINITNHGGGNVYGMKGKYADNYSNENETSVIEMVNTGDGLAVGMYATTNAENTGDITIHNLADGTAVGIMVGNGDLATNSGTITIDRENYTDTKGTDDASDDTTYIAGTSKGGLAIGIYGGENSTITNSSDGKIIINGAENAYGIYAEAGSSVTNNGQIIIDGDANSQNAIKLNRGTLFQDGKLIVDANPEICADGYIEQDGVCYKKLSCPENSTQQTNVCVCNDGYIEQDGVCYKKLSCPENFTQQANVCVCNDGYIEQDGICYKKLSCPENSTQQLNVCICNDGYIEQDGICYRELSCPENSTQQANTCVCNSGYIKQGGVCYQELTCQQNAHQVQDTCDCNRGYILIDGKCQRVGTNWSKNNYSISIFNDDNSDVYGLYAEDEYGYADAYNAYNTYGSYPETGTIDITNTGDGYVYGVYSALNYAFNAYVSYSYGKAFGTINITNEGNGDVYVLYADEAYNAYASGKNSSVIGTINITNNGYGDAYGVYSALNSAYNAYTYDGSVTGTINITNNGYGNVYAVYSALNSAFNAYGSDNATGRIYITNNGYGDIYGVYAKKNVYNAYNDGDHSTATGTIDITNTGDGDVYGLYSANDRSYNAYAISENNTATGTIDITNTGDGDVYGVYSAIYSAYNASSSSGTATGTIDITNNGDGDVYGVYSATYSAYSSSGTATGTIDITNNGDGDVYGVYSATYSAYNASASQKYGTATGTIMLKNSGLGNAYGIFGEYAYNTTDITTTSVVEMVNAGNGLAVGMYGTSYAKNSGDIIIHNLADGTAVGIMVEDNGEVTNSGTITIDRESYTDTKGTSDTTDDETYIAGTEKGGLAIGIYGGKNSTITNTETGKIVINSAENAYGIYAEAGSTVTNNGQIIIDGVTNGEDAIKLNRGTLFQDGKLIVGEKYGNCIEGYIFYNGKCYKDLGGDNGIAYKYNAQNNGIIAIEYFDKEDLYGLYYTLNSANAHAFRSNSTAIGTIDITNSGEANVYGMYSFYSSACSHNAAAFSLYSTATGTLNITNTGNGYVYGVYGFLSTYNATASEKGVANGIVNITNTGNGDVYGLYSRGWGWNAATSDSNSRATGTINITNTGDGDVYGLYTVWEAYNTFPSDSNSRATGTIDITNTGDGDVYGLYTDWEAYNTYASGEGVANGTINIKNIGNGNAYGMKGNSAYNTNDENQTSVIEMVNAGNGLAVGMKATGIPEYYSRASNSGDITIHNLADGTAVGMLIYDDISATNSGTITIDREAYTDTKGTDDASDDETYIAGTSKGGLAIGIYGGENSTITNTETGKIIINGAENAYGIYAEVGSTVTNNGQIIIDGDENSKNAIKLNGGMLFQNGKLIVGTNMEGCAEGYILYNGKCYKDIGGNGIAIKYDLHNNNIITFEYSGNYDVYVLYSLTTMANNAYASGSGSTATKTIEITNTGDGSVYGLYAAEDFASNASAISGKAIATGMVDIKNTGDGNIYGVYSALDTAYNAYASGSGSTATGTIDITNTGDGNIYGVYSALDTAYNAYSYGSYATGTIDITNNGLGDVYGLYSANDRSYNAYAISENNTATGTIDITNNGLGDVYGLYAKSYAYNADAYTSGSTATGTIMLKNLNNGNAYSMKGKYAYNTTEENQTSVIEMVNSGNGLAVGMRATNTAYNSGDITIHNLANGTAVGIMVDAEGTAANRGTITIDRETYTDTKGTEDTTDDVTYIASTEKGGLAVGIYGGENSEITNYTGGKIIINGASETYGIYAEAGSSVTNYGQIIIDGVTNGENAIKLNGGALFQDGKLIVTSESEVAQYALDVASVPLTMFADNSEPTSGTNLDTTDVSQDPTSKPSNQRAGSLNLDDFDGTVIASKTSQFIVEGSISGNLAINNNVVTDGFDTVYRVSDMIQAADSSELNLISQSAMFEASLENGTDAVMTMKSFDEVINNKSFADFLEKNYALENNEKFFSSIKTVEDVASLNKALNQMFGKEMFSRFAFEDLMVMRELNFDINNTLFNSKEEYMSIGGNTNSFAFSGNSRYSLTSNNFGNYSVGLSIAFTDINSDDGNDENLRSDTMYNIATPIGYQIKGLKFVSTPRIGYAYGTYDRYGFNDEIYEGTVKKQMFALMNETRYPFEIGGWTISPSAELNFINYHITGYENDSEYSLKIKSQNNYSIEAGVGLYASKEAELTKNTSIKFNGGVVVYHEFADPYKMKVGMKGMSGSFTLRDEDRTENRAVVQSQFELKHNNMSLIGNVASYIDRKYETDATLDFRFDF